MGRLSRTESTYLPDLTHEQKFIKIYISIGCFIKHLQ